MNTIVKLIIAAIVVAAAVLGFQAYQAGKGSVRQTEVVPSQEGAEEPAATTTRPSAPATATSSVGVARTNDAALGKAIDIVKILAAPGAASTDAQKQAHADLVLSSAIETNTIVISSCKPQPTVSKIRLGSSVYLVNDDAVERVISFGEDMVFPIAAGSTTLATMDFERGPGIYGFGCGDSNGPVGMAVVAE